MCQFTTFESTSAAKAIAEAKFIWLSRINLLFSIIIQQKWYKRNQHSWLNFLAFSHFLYFFNFNWSACREKREAKFLISILQNIKNTNLVFVCFYSKFVYQHAFKFSFYLLSPLCYMQQVSESTIQNIWSIKLRTSNENVNPYLRLWLKLFDSCVIFADAVLEPMLYSFGKNYFSHSRSGKII